MTKVGGPVDDVAVLTAAAAGDSDAVRELLDTAGPVIFGYVIARVGGRRAIADDLVQDTFLEAMRSAHTFRGDSLLTTWLCAIASRRLARQYEAERKEALAEDGLAERHEIDEAGRDMVEAFDQHDAVVRALGRLPVLHRQVLVRKYLDDRAVAEIAAEMGRTAVQIQSLLQRARTGLRQALEVSA